MSLELLFPIDLLLVAVLAAFAISSLVGMLLACMWALQRPLVDVPSVRGPRRLRSDPALEATAGRPPAKA